MKILYITSFFDIKGSSAAVRNAALVKGLVANSHQVDVLTLQHNQENISRMFCSVGFNKIIRTPIKTISLVKKNHATMKKINANNILKSIKDFIRNLIYFPDVYKQWHKIIDYNNIGHYDVVISSSDSKSSHYPAMKIKHLYPNIRWIQIWGDPWSHDIGLDCFTKLRAKFAEHSILKKADKIIYVSQLTWEKERKTYEEYANKMYYVPRSYFLSIKKENSTQNKTEFHITYAGALNASRNSEKLLNAISLYNNTSNNKFIVDYFGEYLPEIRKRLLEYSNVKIHPIIEYSEMLDKFKYTDAFLFISNRSGSTQIPGKLFDYLGTNIPIICVVNKDDKKLLSFLFQFEQCLLFDEDFTIIAQKILSANFHAIDEFAPEVVANKVLQ